MLFWLEMIVSQLDKAIKSAVNLTDLAGNKHLMTSFWLIKRYYPELKDAALKTDNTIDDKVVDELWEAADYFWPDDEGSEVPSSAVSKIEASVWKNLGTPPEPAPKIDGGDEDNNIKEEPGVNLP